MTEDEEKKRRPNANYSLSKPDASGGAEENLNFYYSRERRLENAPESVKKLYREEKPVKSGLFRVLVADKPRAALFITIIILCVVILAFSFLGRFDNSYSLDGNKVRLSATGFEGTSIVVIRKKAGGAQAYTGAIEIAVSPAVSAEDERYPVFYHRVFFTLESEEEYRFVIPFCPDEIAMVLQSEKSSLKIKLKVD